MSHMLLFVLLEGNDDERFFRRILKPLLEKKYSLTRLWKYSEEKHERISRFIHSIKQMDDYVYAHDINNSPSITAKKKEITACFNQVEEDKIVVVVKEIESWYLAGLDEEGYKKSGIKKNFVNTDDITKEKFNRLIPKGMSRIEFMQQILENYKIAIGRRKNDSLRYFLNKWTQ